MPIATIAPVNGTRKREDVKAAVKRMALAVGPNGKLPTVRACCAQLSIAKVTLDAALDDLEAQGVIRRRHGSGIYVTPRIAQKRIGLVFGHDIFDASVSPFYTLLMRRCRERAKSHRERFSFFIDPLPEETGPDGLPVHPDLAEALASEKLHGILLTARNSEAEETWLRAQNVPVVSLGFTEDSPPPVVTIDHRELIRLGVAALSAQGCRRIGLITPYDRDAPVGRIMVHIFKDALKRRHLRLHDAWIWSQSAAPGRDGETRDERGARAFQALFGGGHKTPDGVIIADDMLTRGVLMAARTAGVEVGRNVRIATHANKGSPVLAEWAGRLTLIEVAPDEIVEAMFDLLEAFMAGRSAGAAYISIKPRLQERVVEEVTVQNQGGRR